MRIKLIGRASLSLVVLLCSVHSLWAQAEKIDRRIYKAANDEDFMKQHEGRIPVLVVLEPVQVNIGNDWIQPTPAEIQYELKKKTIGKQWAARQLVNEFIVNSNGPSVRGWMPLWSTNTIIMSASPEAIWEFAHLDEVTQILLDESVAMSEPVEVEKAWPNETDYTYGLKRIRIPELRMQRPDINGEGVVVGILDTGIDPNHPELRGKVVAWRDFVGERETAYDDHGHGTHVAGTIAGEGVGGTQIGIAPKAKLVIGKIFNSSGSAQLSWILQGMEWIANPERKLGSNLRPRAVNNSWGGRMSSDIRHDPFAQQVVNWVQLQIFPSFAAGNAGPYKSTVGSPGGLPMAFAVGATDEDDRVTIFSSRGPVTIIDNEGQKKELIKPDISAPGNRVLSAIPNGGYAKMSGTSMATPHVTGAVALIYQFRPDLSVDQMMTLLMESAEDMGIQGKDNDYGAGRLDVLRALDFASSF